MDNIETRTLATILSDPLPLTPLLFLDYHIADIPDTMKKAIYNMPANVVAVSFNEGLLPNRWKKMVREWCDDMCITTRWWKLPEELQTV